MGDGVWVTVWVTLCGLWWVGDDVRHGMWVAVGHAMWATATLCGCGVSVTMGDGVGVSLCG